MKIDWNYIGKKVLFYTKYILIVVIGLFVLYRLGVSLIFRPKDVIVTNLSSGSFSVSWVTDYRMKGKVYYSDKDGILPLFLSGLNSKGAYDDRDTQNAEIKCVEQLNSEIEKEGEDNYVVDGDDFNCSSVKVSKADSYYTHHVTIKNLDPEKEYFFRVGDGVFSWKAEEYKAQTFSLEKSVGEPVPIFGRIKGVGEGYSSDSIVYARFNAPNNGDGVIQSVTYSSVTNEDGGWYIDGNNLRKSDGSVLGIELGDSSIVAQAQYKNWTRTEPILEVFNYLDEIYPDIEVEDKGEETSMSEFVKGVMAWIPSGGGSNEKRPSDYRIESPAPSGGSGDAGGSGDGDGGGSGDGDGGGSGDGDGDGGGGGSGGGGCAWENRRGCTTDSDLEIVLQNRWEWGPGNTAKILSENYGMSLNQIARYFGTEENAIHNINAILPEGKRILEDDYLEGNNVRYGDYAGQNGRTVIDNLVYRAGEGWVLSSESPTTPNTSSGVEGGAGSREGKAEESAIFTFLGDSGDVEMDFGGKKVKLDRAEYVDLIDPDVITEMEKKCGGKNDCTYNVKLIDMSIGNLVNNNKKIKECLRSSTCYEGNTALQGALATEILAWDKKGTDAEGDLEFLRTLLEGFSDVQESSSVTIYHDEGYKESGAGLLKEESYIDPDWLSKFSEYATDDEKRRLASDLGFEDISTEESVSDIEFKMVNNDVIIFYNENGITKHTKPEELDGRIYFSKETYMEIEEITSGESGETYAPKEYSSNDEEMRLFTTVDSANVEQDNAKCLSTGCSKEDAENVYETISKKDASNGEYYVYVKNEDDTYTVMRVLNEDELQDVVDESKDKAEELRAIEAEATPGSGLVTPLFRNLILGKVFAQEENNVSGSIYYLPEYGMYSLQLGDFELKEDVSGEKTIYLFYLEVNGQEGFQMPADVDNPTVNEDIVLKSESYQINFEKKSTTREYNLNEGINIVSFDFVPPSVNDEAYSARDLVAAGDGGTVGIEFVSYFEGGRWESGYKCENGECVGSDFAIIPGRGYLIKAENSGVISVPAYDLKSSIPLNFSAGWNLVGVHGYSQAYTAKSLIESINSVEGLTVDNVSWYPTSKGRYEGFQLTEDVEYGLDYAIDPKVGYFVRVSDFSPTDEKCRTILWHEGGSQNGVCGDYKSILGN